MKERITYIDNLRFIAIVCVIFLHIISLFRGYYFNEDITKLYYYTFLDSFTRIGVPLFFMITGVLSLSKSNKIDYIECLKKKLPKLVISYLVFSYIYIFYDIIKNGASISFFDSIQIITSKQASYHLWYMPTIITIYILIPFINKLINKLTQKELIRLIIVIYLLGNVLSAVNVVTARLGRPLLGNFMLSNLAIYINYLLIGYYIEKNSIKITKKLIITSIICIILIPICSIFISNIEIKDFFLNSTSPFVVFPTILVYLFIKEKNKEIKISKYLSNKIVYIYLSHVLFLNIIQDRIVSKISKTNILEQGIIILISFIFILLSSTILSIIIDKIINIIKRKNELIINILIKIFTVIFSITFSYITICIITNRYNFAYFKYPILVLGIIILIITFVIINKYKGKLFNNKIINIIYLITYIAFQILIVKIFAVRPTWDFGGVYYSAIESASGVSNLNQIYYLYMCINNIPITTFFALIFKPLFLLGLNKYTGIVALIINIFSIDISLLYLYLIVKRINEKYSIPYIILCIFFSPLIFYLPIFYTDTLSMPFIIIGIYYFYKFLFEKDNKRYIIISGIILGIGTLIKNSVLIIFISLIIIMILKNKKYQIKTSLKLIFILCTIFPLLINKIYIKTYFNSEKIKKENHPYTHFIMMGLKENGGFNEEDLQFTLKYKNEEEKKKENIKEIKKRLSKYYEENKLLKFYDKKINYTWADGTLFANRKLAIEPINEKNIIYIKYNNSSESALYNNLSNAQWLLLIIFILIGSVFSKFLNEKQKIFQLQSNIAIFGLFMFLLIWETRSRYLVNFIPILLISAYIGLVAFINYIKEKQEYKNEKKHHNS